MRSQTLPALMKSLQRALADFPRAHLTHAPTPLEKMARLPLALSLSAAGAGAEAAQACAMYVKRDDCTGLALGGNKARQLEFHLGEALARNCDRVFSTAAVQSNHLRTLAAAAAAFGLECHLQLEPWVNNHSEPYHHCGNVLLNRLFGAALHHYPADQDEAGAEQALADLAAAHAARGGKPYIIPLRRMGTPLGALGYVAAALELAQQIEQQRLPIELLAVASGSGITHAGLLSGLRWLGITIPVLGVCVRRDAAQQRRQVLQHCQNLADLLGWQHENAVAADDVWVDDSALAPGYGAASAQVKQDMLLVARSEGLLSDPVYSGKTFSCVLNLIRNGGADRFRHIAILHTGGIPGLFAHREERLADLPRSG